MSDGNFHEFDDSNVRFIAESMDSHVELQYAAEVALSQVVAATTMNRTKHLGMVALGKCLEPIDQYLHVYCHLGDYMICLWHHLNLNPVFPYFSKVQHPKFSGTCLIGCPCRCSYTYICCSQR
jgi:hypothetical protein